MGRQPISTPPVIGFRLIQSKKMKMDQNGISNHKRSARGPSPIPAQARPNDPVQGRSRARHELDTDSLERPKRGRAHKKKAKRSKQLTLHRSSVLSALKDSTVTSSLPDRAFFFFFSFAVGVSRRRIVRDRGGPPPPEEQRLGICDWAGGGAAFLTQGAFAPPPLVVARAVEDGRVRGGARLVSSPIGEACRRRGGLGSESGG